MSSTSRGVTVPDEETEREVQGAWGGNTNGVGTYADVNGIRPYYEVLGAGHPSSFCTAGSARSRCSACRGSRIT